MAEIIELSAFDQVVSMARPQIRLLYYAGLPDIDRLNASLAHALARYPQVATALETAADGSRRLVGLPSPPVVRQKARLDRLTVVPTADDFDYFIGGLEDSDTGAAFVATLTPVAGGAVLGVKFSHALGDATSLYMFLSHWCDVLRVAEDAHPASSTVAGPSADPGDVGQAQPDRFGLVNFDQLALEDLQRRLTNGDFTPTRYEAVTAFLLHRYGQSLTGRSRDLRLRIAIGLRGLHPDVPRDFFGNAFLETLVPLDILDNGTVAVRVTAERIREAISGMRRPGYAQSVVEVRGGAVHVAGGTIPSFDVGTDILSTSHGRLPYHRLDMGVGPAHRVFCVSTAPTGFVIINRSNTMEAHMVSERHSLHSERHVAVRNVGLSARGV